MNLIAEKTDHEISIESVKITWLDRVSFKNFLVKDTEKDSMLFAKNLAINYEILDLIQQDYLSIEEISSDELLISLVRYDSTSKMNLSKFTESIFSTPSNSDKSKPISVKSLGLSNLRFKMADKSQARNYNQVDFNHLSLEVPLISLEDFAINGDTLQGVLSQFSGSEVHSGFMVDQLEGQFELSSQSLS